MSEINPIWTAGDYGTNRFALSKNLRGSVSWNMDVSDKNYQAYFLGTNLGSFNALDEAKAAVETRAKAELEFALKKLNRQEGA